MQIMSEAINGYMYRLDFPNGKSYVGVTNSSPHIRFNQHVKMSRSDKAKAVHHAIKKYGKDNVIVKTLAVGCMKYLYNLEIKAIDVFGTRYPSGYNLTIGGDGAKGLDEITRRKMGEKNKGRIASEQTRIKMSEARKLAPPPSLETRLKLSAAAKGKRLSEDHRKKIGLANLGRIISEETRIKISKAKKGTTLSKSNIEMLKKINSERVRGLDERMKISAALKGRKKSLEHSEKLRISATGRKHTDEAKMKVSMANKGKVLSEETREKISKAAKARYASKEFRSRLVELKLNRKSQPSDPHKRRTKLEN